MDFHSRDVSPQMLYVTTTHMEPNEKGQGTLKVITECQEMLQLVREPKQETVVSGLRVIITNNQSVFLPKISGSFQYKMSVN